MSMLELEGERLHDEARTDGRSVRILPDVVVVDVELGPEDGLPVTEVDISMPLAGPSASARYTMTDEGHYG